MRQKVKNGLKISIGLAISAFFLYLAFREVDLAKMGQAFRQANYLLLLPAIAALFISAWLRALRHRYFLAPIKFIKTGALFIALIIGYMANMVLPAHLGELLRAYIIGKKEKIPASSALATIAVERIIDVLTLLVLMAFTLAFFPFPDWVKTSGYLTFAFALALVGFLILLKLYTEKTLQVVRRCTQRLPSRISNKLLELLRTFTEGVVPLRSGTDYVVVAILSVLIWVGYAGVFFVSFYAFDFTSTYHLPWHASLVLLVITAISVVVPSSPGYIGTYHWLCMKGLELFGVPDSAGLSFAIVVHALSFAPVALLGFILTWKEGVSLTRVQKEEREIVPAGQLG